MKCKNCGYESPIRTHASGQGIPTSVSGEVASKGWGLHTSVRSAVSKTRSRCGTKSRKGKRS